MNNDLIAKRLSQGDIAYLVSKMRDAVPARDEVDVGYLTNSFQCSVVKVFAPRVVQGRSPIRIAYGDGGSRCRQGPTALRFPLSTFLDSSMVEHSAVNRRVVGSSPTRGVNVVRCHRR